jgi:tape measure domain-containing protein
MAGQPIEELIVSIQADITGLRQGMNQISNEIKQTADKGSSHFNILEGASKAFGLAIAGATAAVGLAQGAVVGFGVHYNAELETASQAFDVLLGGADKAKAMMSDLQKFGANTPFEFNGLQQSAKLLLAMGTQSKDIMPYMQKLGDAVAAVGGNDDMLESVSRAIGQIQAKGKLSAEEMQQMAEAGLPVWDVLAQKMGKSTAELMNMTSQGKILAKDAVPLLVDGLGTKFAGAMDKQSKTFSGMMSTLKDNMGMLAGQISEPVFNMIKGVLPQLIDMVNKVSAAFTKGGWTEVFKELLPPSLSGTINAVGIAFKDLKVFISGVADVLSGNFSKGQEVLEKTFGSGAGGFIAAWAENIQREFEVVGAVFDILFGNVEKGGSILESVFGSEIGSAITTGVESIRSVIDGLIGVLDVLFGNVSSGTFEMSQAFGADFATGITQIIEQVKIAFQSLLTIAEALFKGFVETIQWAWGLLSPIIMPILKDIVKFIGDMLYKINQFWAENGKMIMDAVSNVFNFIKGVIEFVMPAVKLVIDTVWTVIKNIFSTALDIIMGVVNFFAALFTGNWSKMGESLKNIWDSIWNFIKNILSAGWDFLKGIFDLMFGWIPGVYEKIKNSVVQSWDNMWSTLKNAVSNAWSSISGAFSSLWSSISDWFGSLPHKMAEFGSNIVEGLWNGIKNLGSWIKDKVVSWVREHVPDAIADLMGIHSPSRLMMEYGGYIGQGLAIGITDTGKHLKDSVVSTLKNVTDPIEGFNAGNIDIGINKPKLEDALASASMTASAMVTANQQQTMAVQLSLEGGIDVLAEHIEARVISNLNSKLGGVI